MTHSRAGTNCNDSTGRRRYKDLRPHQLANYTRTLCANCVTSRGPNMYSQAGIWHSLRERPSRQVGLFGGNKRTVRQQGPAAGRVQLAAMARL